VTFNRTFATTVRILNQIRHDPRTVVMLLLMPSLLIGLMSWIFMNTPVFEQAGPALIALFPFMIMFLVTSITTLRERRSGTLERLLAMPLERGDYIVGYALAFGFLAIIQSALAVGFAVWVCGLQVNESAGLLLTVAIADAVLGSTLGLFASAFARTEFQVIQLMPLLIFPQILLGGILLPRSNMPDPLYSISDWLPLSHAVDAINAVSTGTIIFIGISIFIAIVLGSLTLRRRSR
jgi:ABC-2 type transport system permease protein